MERRRRRLAFCSYFKNGASTLISALVGLPDLLPREDCQCTGSLCFVSGGSERLRVTYFAPREFLEATLRARRFECFWDSAARDEVLSDYSEDRAIDFIRSRTLADQTGDHLDEADLILDPTDGLLAAFAARRSLLGKSIDPPLGDLRNYVRWEGGRGHVMLVKSVEISVPCPFLEENHLEVVDGPGLGSDNFILQSLAREVLESADAAVFLHEERGLAVNFNRMCNTVASILRSLSPEVCSKMFIAATMADKGDPVPYTELDHVYGTTTPNAFFEHFYRTLGHLGIGREKVFFTSALMNELEEARRRGTLSSAKERDLSEIHARMKGRLATLWPDLRPEFRERMEAGFATGGVDDLRRAIVADLNSRR